MLSHVMNDVATIIIPYQTFWLLRNMYYIPSTNAISEGLKWSINSSPTENLPEIIGLTSSLIY